MEPREIWAYEEGRQRHWNQVCRLAAWCTLLIVKSIPSFSKSRDWRSRADTPDKLIEMFPPPGFYEKKPAKKAARRG